MAGPALWKGSIRFRDVDIPVKLYTAVKQEQIHFHLLHRRDRVKLRLRMICAYEKLPVPEEEQARGFEIEKRKYLIVNPEELEGTAPASSRTIEVHEFVATGQIDPLFLGHVYYLEPEGPGKGYLALRGGLSEMHAAGICTWTMRKRSYLGALMSAGKMLRLCTLRYADEVMPAGSLDLPEIPLSEKELKIGSELINHLAAPFEPGKFRNEHLEKLRALIEKKARGGKITLLRPRSLKPTPSDELLKALEAGLKKVA